MSDHELQNLYDNQEFFDGYARARKNPIAMNYTLEQPIIRGLLPKSLIASAKVLDLGCGTGGFARWLIDEGATSVLGVDPSANMLEVAQESAQPSIEYRQAFVEELELPSGQFDLVVSSLMFHYIEDLRPVVEKIRSWMTTGGALVFSIEHPIATSSQDKQSRWLENDKGERVGWEVTNYSVEGARVSRWIVDGVVKYHRTMATMLNVLAESGFRIDRVSEDHASEENEALDPQLLQERLRPSFLFVRAIAD